MRKLLLSILIRILNWVVNEAIALEDKDLELNARIQRHIVYDEFDKLT